MKKLIPAFALVLSAFISHAQTVNDIPIKDIDVEYLQIVGTPRALSSKLNVRIDFGQRTKLFSNNRAETIVKDADGRPVEFNSMIDALNFMSKNGFEFVQALIVANPVNNNQAEYQYLMRNRKNKANN